MLGDILFQIYDEYEKIHIIATGMGAHLAGFAGKTILKYTEKSSRIGRISGLDPALPLFNGTNNRLEKTDASVVDVYHCDIGRYGYKDSIGTVDFFPNGGLAPLPGCNDTEQPVTMILYGAVEDGKYNISVNLCR